MLAVRRGASGAARQLQRTVRTYASEAHGQPKAGEGNESFGIGSIATVGVFFGGILIYQTLPNEGEESAISRMISNYSSRAEHWADRNALHTRAVEQAGFDRNLFENGSAKHKYVEMAYPEAFHAHSPRNLSPGHLINLDHVVDHYKQLAASEEVRKSERAASRKA